MRFAETQRAALARLLDKVGPNAPTIAGEWTTHDLVAHLWVRENDLLALPGIGLAAFGKLTQERMHRAKATYDYPELVRRFREPPIWTKAMSAANKVEFFVHRLDVLRADQGLEHSRPSRADEDVLWRAAKLLGMRLRGSPVGVVLERSDAGDRHRLSRGSHTVTVLGAPSELIMYLTGRGEHANLDYVGLDADVARVRALPLGL